MIVIDRRFYPCRYAMAIEPYPYGDAARENPSLLASDDGLRWRVPAGVVNPVVPAPPAASGWNSDGDIVSVGGELLALYYRYNSGRGETTLLRTVSADGAHWTDPARLFSVAPSGRFASPAVVDWQGRLRMLYVDTLDRAVGALSSTDGVRWSDERRLFRFPAAWHLDSTVAGGYLYVLLNDGHSLFLLRSPDLEGWMVFARSEGRWRAWADRLGAAPPLLRPSQGGWDDRRIYRGSGLFEGPVLRLWYSAESSGGEWRVGYTEGHVPT